MRAQVTARVEATSPARMPPNGVEITSERGRLPSAGMVSRCRTDRTLNLLAVPSGFGCRLRRGHRSRLQQYLRRLWRAAQVGTKILSRPERSPGQSVLPPPTPG
jgi:hypothetical protein